MAKLLDWLPFRFKKGDKNGANVPVHRAPAQPDRRAGGAPAWPATVGGSPSSLSAWAGGPWTLARQMDELMERLWSGSPAGALLSDFFGDFSTPFSPTLDVVDDEDAMKVIVEVPGLGPDDVQVEVREGALTISGEKRLEREHEDHGFYRSERSFGRFQRVVPLPSNLDLDHAEATQQEGVLTVRLPKVVSEAPRSRRISVHRG